MIKIVKNIINGDNKQQHGWMDHEDFSTFLVLKGIKNSCDQESASWMVDDNKLNVWDEEDENGEWMFSVWVEDHSIIQW